MCWNKSPTSNLVHFQAEIADVLLQPQMCSSGSRCRMAATAVACVNPKSGGLRGAKVLEVLRKILGAEKCLNVLQVPSAAEWLVENFGAEENLRILICGGDGTISRVVDSYVQVVSRLSASGDSASSDRQLDVLRKWAFAPIPIGTGNDLARTLGWGSNLVGVSGPFFEGVVRYAVESVPVPLDTWQVTRKRLRRQQGSRSSSLLAHFSSGEASANRDRSVRFASAESGACAPGQGSDSESDEEEESTYARRFTMLSYLSLGCDADVELLFNSRREANPRRYRSQTLNYISHALFGIERTMLSRARPLYKERITLYVDGQRIKIPRAAQSLLFANIPSYGAGADPGGVARRQRRALARKQQQVLQLCRCFHRRSSGDHTVSQSEAHPPGGSAVDKHAATIDARTEGAHHSPDPVERESSQAARQDAVGPHDSVSSAVLPCVDDGRLDIMTMKSLVHFVWIKMGREAQRLRNGRKIRIELEESRSSLVRAASSLVAKHIAVQCDGEAWNQARNECIEIEPFSFQVGFLLGPLYAGAIFKADSRMRLVRGLVAPYLKPTSAPSAVFSQPDSIRYIEQGLSKAGEAFLAGVGERARIARSAPDVPPRSSVSRTVASERSISVERSGHASNRQLETHPEENDESGAPKQRERFSRSRWLSHALGSCFGGKRQPAGEPVGAK